MSKAPADWESILKKTAPHGKHWVVIGFADALPLIVDKYEVNTETRQAHFISQCAHESDSFQTTTEYASGAAYEGRKDLGNTVAGDGRKFKGRGLIQLTGRFNYANAAHAMGLPLLEDPELVAKFPAAALVSGWWWNANGCNQLADKDDAKLVTMRVNGGYNGLDQRLACLSATRSAMA